MIDMENGTYEKALRHVLPPVAVFILVGFFYLVTITPSIWYADAFSYIGVGVALNNGGISLPYHHLIYLGWDALISLLPAAHATTPFNDALQVMLAAKFLSIFFSVTASVGVFLVAKRLFASTAFAFIVAAIFATNPIIWLEGQGALSDLPAAAFMIFSFLFFIRFYQGRKGADLAIAALLVGIAAVVRAQSLLLFVPFLIGILSIAFETPQQPFIVRLKVILKLGTVMGVFALALPLAVFGMPWALQDTITPISLPHLSEVQLVLKWYIARDIGWMWFLLAWTGLAAGLYRKATRAIALMLVTLIAVGATYFASTIALGADIPRFLVPTVPFTLLGMGFLWPVARMRVKAAFSLLVVAYVFGIFIGLRSPYPPGTREPSKWAKVFSLQRWLASDAARTYIDNLPLMMTYNAMAAVLPDGAVVIVQGYGNRQDFYINLRGKHGIIRLISIVPRVPESERFHELSSLPEGKPILVYPGPDDAKIMAILKKNGFTGNRNVCGAALLMKPKILGTVGLAPVL